MQRFFTHLLLALWALVFSTISISEYAGSQAYNHANSSSASVNIATGTFQFSYPLIKTAHVSMPFSLNLNYRYNTSGRFGLPKGWQLDVDHIDKKIAVIGSNQWIIDPLWHDETLYASGLKYYNQHGNFFQDFGTTRKIPRDESRFYRYKLKHKDGSIKFFSNQGLLVTQQDRFGNRTTLEYEEPVGSLKSAKLSAIIDNYGNRYTFNYEPNTLIVELPDGKQLKVYYTHEGVTTIINSMEQRYEFNYINISDQNLLHTFKSPAGLFTEISYDTIPFIHSSGKGEIPVVIHYKQTDLATNEIQHESHYSYAKGNNFTGYPLYAMSDSTDNLMESNDFNFRYAVEVKQTDGNFNDPIIHHKVHEYNFLHLPIEVRTYKNNDSFTKTVYSYTISPFKYSRSTNYDKPISIIHAVWNKKKGEYIPSNRIDKSYDVYGNKIKENHSVYHRYEEKWHKIRETTHKYFTSHFSLLAETVNKDMTSEKAIKTQYYLSPSNKTHSKLITYTLVKKNQWQPWQQVNYCYDRLGRQIFKQLQWLAKGMPGVQKTTAEIKYHFNKSSAILTTVHKDSLGNVTKGLVDTRNNQLIAHVSALGEKTQYFYNNLGQLIRHIDPAGAVYKYHHYIYDQDGFNATEAVTPLGFKQRIRKNASGKVTFEEELSDGKYEVITERKYNAFGKIKSQKNRYNLTSYYQYDDQMRLIENTDQWSNKISYVYDDNNMSLHTYINGDKHKTVKKYPWLLKVKTIIYSATRKNKTHPIAIEKQIKRNGFGQVNRSQSALLDTQSLSRYAVINSTYTYDAGYNETSIKTDGFNNLSLIQNRSYDLFHNLYSVVKKQNNNGKINQHTGYRYLYNSANQLERVLAPLSEDTVAEYRYDKNGRVIESILPDGHSIKNQYDPRGLIESIHWQREGRQYQVFYRYDADRRIMENYDIKGKKIYTYDLKGNLIRVVHSDNRQQTYAFDNKGRRISQKHVDNTVLTYEYKDKDKGKLSAISDGSSKILFTYGEDDNGIKGRLLSIERAITGTPPTQETLSYEPFGRVARTEVTTDKGKQLLSNTYHYLPRGELVKHHARAKTADGQEANKVTTYDYDALQRLIKETHTHHSEASILNLPREIHYEYDANDNLLTEQHISTDGTVQHINNEYNTLDQLVQIKKDNPPSTVDITYDINGRMVVDHKGNNYCYDDFGLLMAVTDQNNKSLLKLHYSPEGFLEHIEKKQSSGHFYYDTNHRAQTMLKNGKWHNFIQYKNKYLGVLTEDYGEQLFIANKSTGAKLGTDTQGKNIATLYAYQGYGEPDTTEKLSTDFLWNQEMMDQTTGLVYLRNRFYHPELKRFITRDNHKVSNLYAYGLGNPIAFTDPTGNSVSQGLNYGIGALNAVLGIIGVAFAIPSAGTSLAWSMGTAASVSSALAGISQMGGQGALDSGNKEAGIALIYTSFGLAAAATMETIAAIAPSLTKYGATGIALGKGISESDTPESAALTDQAINDRNIATTLRSLINREAYDYPPPTGEPPPPYGEPNLPSYQGPIIIQREQNMYQLLGALRTASQLSSHAVSDTDTINTTFLSTLRLWSESWTVERGITLPETDGDTGRLNYITRLREHLLTVRGPRMNVYLPRQLANQRCAPNVGEISHFTQSGRDTHMAILSGSADLLSNFSRPPWYLRPSLTTIHEEG